MAYARRTARHSVRRTTRHLTGRRPASGRSVRVRNRRTTRRVIRRPRITRRH